MDEGLEITQRNSSREEEQPFQTRLNNPPQRIRRQPGRSPGRAGVAVDQCSF